jgi:hypothetical protein
MDKTIFVRTSKGEDEMRNKTAQLSVDIKRTLLMVDGISTIREISKRVAPSLRMSLGDIFKELLKDGYIDVKVKDVSQRPTAIITPIKATTPVKMTMPTKISIPTLKPVDDGINELDFAAGFSSQAEQPLVDEPENAELALQKKTAEEARFRAEIKARVEAEFGEEIKARVEAEMRAEAKAREEAETKKRMQDEANAIDEARELAEERARAEAKAQTEAKARAEAEAVIAAKARVEEERRLEALAREAAEAKKRAAEEARLLAEAKAKQEAEAKARAEAEAKEKARLEAIAIAEEKARIEAEIRAEAKARIEAEMQKMIAEEARLLAEKKAKQEAEAKAIAEEKARVEAEKARVEAEKKAIAEAKARAEAEAKKRMEEESRALAEAQAKQEAEAKALEAAKLRAEAELKSIAEAKLRAETEAKAIAEAKARIEAEMRAEAQARIDEENAIHKEAEHVAKQERLAAEALQKQKDQLAAEVREKLLRSAQDEELKRQEQRSAQLLSQSKLETNAENALSETDKSKSGAYPIDRSTSATVLFFDMVGYTKLSVNKQIEVKGQFNQLVSDCLAEQGEGERVILDTGDGAAIGFMQHPEDALHVARQFRKVLIANQHNDYPELNVRIGVHMGPVSIVKDMNGQSNMVGDAINDAQRVMGFAGTDQIFISRAYYDFISRLSDTYADIFYYQGSQKDKHGREHHVYKLMDVVASTFENNQHSASSSSDAVKLEPFNFNVADEIVKTMTPAKRKPTQQAILKEVVKLEAQIAEVAQFAETTAKHTDEEVKSLESEQAKLWADAEQEALESAKSNTLRIIQPQVEKLRAAKYVASARVKREPIPWGKVVVGFFLVLLATLFIAPYVFPMRSFVPKVEKLLTEKFQQPVHVGSLAGRLLPTPRLDLIEVSIGEDNQIKAQLARANFSPLTLLTNKKSISSLELESAQIDGVALQEVSIWMQNAAADKQFPIAKIVINDSKLEANGIQLSAVGGELNFNNTGDFSTANLFANGHKLLLDMDASSGDKTTVAITAHASALPLLPNWVFDDFSAKGELTNSALVITEIDSHISAGILHGNARLDWHSGWSMEGALSAKAISAQNISGTITGEAEGTARFQMHAPELAKLTDTATMDGSLVMNQGVINGIDIVETATRRRTENLPGGRTHFDELWSDFSFANDAYAFRQLKLKAGVMTAKGTLDISKQQLSGRMSVDLALRTDSMGLVPLQIGGSADNPTLWMTR